MKFETAKQWIESIDKAKLIKKEWRERMRVDLAYQYRDGIQRPDFYAEEEWISINKFYSVLRSELPSLYASDPYFYISLARTFQPDPALIAEYEQKAEIRQSMINYLKREIGLKEIIRACITDAMFQYGVAKIYYAGEHDKIDEETLPVSYRKDGTAIFDHAGQVKRKGLRKPLKTIYKTTRIHPDDFLLDPLAGVLPDTWSWAAQRILMDREEFEERAYSLPDNMTIERLFKNYSTSISQPIISSPALYDSRKTVELIEVYECYDIRHGEWCVVCDAVNDFLLKPEKYPEGIEDMPFVLLFLGLRHDKSWLPIPPATQWIDLQREYSYLRSKIMTHRKRFNRKYALYDGAFADPDAAATRLETGGDGTVVRQVQPGIAVYAIQDAPLDSNYVNELMLIRNDFVEIAHGGNQMGSGAGIDSATEASIVEKRALLQDSTEIGNVTSFVTNIARKLDQIVQANITEDEAIKVTGPSGDVWRMIRQDDYDEIEGEYSYTISAGSTIPHLPEIERSQFMAFLSMIAQAPMLGLSRPLLKKIAEMHNIDDPSIVDDLFNIAKQMAGGSLPENMAASGSMPNIQDLLTKIQSTAGGINNVRKVR